MLLVQKLNLHLHLLMRMLTLVIDFYSSKHMNFAVLPNKAASARIKSIDELNKIGVIPYPFAPKDNAAAPEMAVNYYRQISLQLDKLLQFFCLSFGIPHCFHGRDQYSCYFFYNTIRVTSSCIMIWNWFNRTSNVLFVYRNATNLSVEVMRIRGSCTVLLFSLHPVTSLKRSQFLLCRSIVVNEQRMT
jgi:hypothetical protein